MFIQVHECDASACGSQYIHSAHKDMKMYMLCNFKATLKSWEEPGYKATISYLQFCVIEDYNSIIGQPKQLDLGLRMQLAALPIHRICQSQHLQVTCRESQQHVARFKHGVKVKPVQNIALRPMPGMVSLFRSCQLPLKPLMNGREVKVFHGNYPVVPLGITYKHFFC